MVIPAITFPISFDLTQDKSESSNNPREGMIAALELIWDEPMLFTPRFCILRTYVSQFKTYKSSLPNN